MRRLALAGILVTAFAVVLALTFPTDAAVRALLARVPLPNGIAVDFTRAHLGPRGLQLDDVAVTGADGRRAFAATWVRLRPSLWGLLRDRTGRPWSFAAALCQGEIAVTIDTDGRASLVDATVRDVELASCVPYLRPDADVYGHVSGEARVRWPSEEAASGAGTVAVRGFAWRPGGPLEDTRLRADQANARWELADRRLTVESADASSTDFAALGHGTVRRTVGRQDGSLDLLVTVTPGRTMPPMLRRLFEAIEGVPPAATGSRTFRVQGTLGAPRMRAVSLTE